jgi:hypothetical protein
VEFQLEKAASGWDAPPQAPWLTSAIDAASRSFYSQPPAYFGEGGSIPFMGMLGELFPQAQFVVTGVLGPGSNAHGPNEFLHIDFTKKIICCVTEILAGVAIVMCCFSCSCAAFHFRVSFNLCSSLNLTFIAAHALQPPAVAGNDFSNILTLF